MVGASRAATFLRWRWALYISLFFGWCAYYFCRKSFPASIPNLIADNGLSKDDIGTISSSFAAAYGFSKFFNSILSDHVSARKMFSVGLLLSGLGCLVFPFSAHSVPISASVWFMEGIIQGLGWAPCAKLLKVWYPPSAIGTWWSLLSTAGNVAAAISPLLVTYLSSVYNWRVSFTVVGAIAIAIGLIVTITIKDSPSELGIELPFQKSKTDERKVSETSSLRWYSPLFYGNLWVASTVYAALYAVKNAVADWSQLYFIQAANKSQAASAACVGMVQIGGITGLLVSGYVSDLFITPKTMATKCPRAPVLLCISVLMLIALQLFASTVTEGSSELWLSVMIFALGFLSDGGISVSGLISMEVVPSQISGSAHGLACAVAQVGGFAAGWPFAHVIEQYGWSSAYYSLEVCATIMVGLSSYLLLLMLRGLAQPKRD